MLWRPPEGAPGEPIDVDPLLTRWLRPHQREGVQFMFDCVLGLRQSTGFGCILADDMGLGEAWSPPAVLAWSVCNRSDMWSRNPRTLTSLFLAQVLELERFCVQARLCRALRSYGRCSKADTICWVVLPLPNVSSSSVPPASLETGSLSARNG